MNFRARTVSIVVSSLLLAMPINAEEPEAADPWALVRVLFGEWPGDGALVFTSENTEGAGRMAARLTFTFEETDSYHLALELASPGKDFLECQTMHMERVAKE